MEMGIGHVIIGSVWTGAWTVGFRFGEHAWTNSTDVNEIKEIIALIFFPYKEATILCIGAIRKPYIYKPAQT